MNLQDEARAWFHGLTDKPRAVYLVSTDRLLPLKQARTYKAPELIGTYTDQISWRDFWQDVMEARGALCMARARMKAQRKAQRRAA